MKIGSNDADTLEAVLEAAEALLETVPASYRIVPADDPLAKARIDAHGVTRLRALARQAEVFLGGSDADVSAALRSLPQTPPRPRSAPGWWTSCSRRSASRRSPRTRRRPRRR